jgi:hypothetical protein
LHRKKSAASVLDIRRRMATLHYADTPKAIGKLAVTHSDARFLQAAFRQEELRALGTKAAQGQGARPKRYGLRDD